MSIVLDASVTLPWVLADEATAQALAVRERVRKEGALTAQHWKLEVCNGLLMAARRKRYDLASLSADLFSLGLLPVLVDQSTNDVAWEGTALIAQAHKLTAYDAAYLELAQRSGLPLATFDADLAKAARAEGVKVI